MAQRSTIADRLAAIRELVVVLQTEMPRIRYRPGDEMSAFVASLGMARVVRLLQAMLLMNDHNLRDVAALPLRQLFEVWLISLYCLLGGQKAIDELQGAHHKQISTIPVKALRRALQQVESESIESKALHWEQLSVKVGTLVEANGDAGARDRISELYNTVYRGESLTSVHGGIGTVGGQAVEKSGNLVLRPKRADSKSAVRVIIVAGVFVDMLASHVLNAYGLAPQRFDALAAIINREPRRG